jgi:uncharacterized Ntn-hydrolase superfamily protein
VTYSIVAFDPESGAYGVAVQSHWFNVGRSAAWVRFGVGAVVTQALTDPSYGWLGLDAMASGHPPQEALDGLLAGDPERERRQVGFVDTEGRVAVHTGERCIRHASHFVGEGWAVLGNLLVGEAVLEAMAGVFVEARGTLPERMVAALAAAEEQGGDVRGVQSAAIRIVPGGSEFRSGQEAGVSISVADHEDPIGELRRLVAVDRSYRELTRGQAAAEVGDEAIALHHLALAGRLRHGVELDFWRAIALMRLGREDEARAVMAEVVADAPRFEEVLSRVGEVDPVAASFLNAPRAGSQDGT